LAGCYESFGGTACTLGFNTFDGTAFLTNSHCSQYRGPEANPTIQYQPNRTIGAGLGYETNDPSYFSAATAWDCPTELMKVQI